MGGRDSRRGIGRRLSSKRKWLGGNVFSAARGRTRIRVRGYDHYIGLFSIDLKIAPVEFPSYLPTSSSFSHHHPQFWSQGKFSIGGLRSRRLTPGSSDPLAPKSQLFQSLFPIRGSWSRKQLFRWPFAQWFGNAYTPLGDFGGEGEGWWGQLSCLRWRLRDDRSAAPRPTRFPHQSPSQALSLNSRTEQHPARERKLHNAPRAARYTKELAIPRTT